MKRILPVVIILLVFLMSTVLVACDGSNIDNYVFKIEGIEGYSDAVINKDERRISFNVKDSAVNELPLSIIKVPEGTIVKAYYDKEMQKPIEGNLPLVVGENVFYLYCEYVWEDVKYKVLWTMNVEKMTSVIKVESIETTEWQENYFVGDAFAGGKIKVNKNNGTSEIIDITASMLTGFDTSVAGEKNVTITYEDVECVKTINVQEVKVTSIDIIDWQEAYFVGDEFVAGKIKVNKNNNTSEEVVITSDMLKGFDTSASGTKDVIIMYGGVEKTVQIEVAEVKVVDIAIKEFLTRYKIGAAFVGGKLSVTYNNGDIKDVDITESMVTGFDTSTLGDKNIVISYEGHTVNATITVDALQVVSISINEFDRVYYVGDSFKGGKIDVAFDNDTVKTIEITSGMLTGFDTTDAGEKEITVTYEGKTCSVTITVNEIVAVSIGIEEFKTDYYVGDVFYGGKIVVNYNNGDIINVDVTEDMLSGFDTSSVGEKEVTVTYDGVSSKVTINVVIPDVKSLDINELKDVYDINDTVIEGSLKVILANGETKIIPITEDMVTGFEPGKAGKNSITISYAEQEIVTFVKVVYLNLPQYGDIAPGVMEFETVAKIVAEFAATIDAYLMHYSDPADKPTYEEAYKYNYDQALMTGSSMNETANIVKELIEYMGISDNYYKEYLSSIVDFARQQMIELTEIIEKNEYSYIDMARDIATVERITALFDNISAVMNHLRPEQVANGMRYFVNIASGSSSSYPGNFEEYLKQFEGTKYYEILLKQKEWVDEVFEVDMIGTIFDENELEFTSETLYGILKNIIALGSEQMVSTTHFILDFMTDMSENDIMSTIDKYTAKGLVGHVNFIGNVYDAVVRGLYGRNSAIESITLSILNNLFSSSDYVSQAIPYGVNNLLDVVFDSVDSLDIVSSILTNITTEDVTNIYLSVDDYLKADESARKVKTGFIIIDSAKVIKRLYDNLDAMQKVQLENIYNGIKEKIFENSAKLSFDDILKYMNNCAALDTDTVTDQEVLAIVDEGLSMYNTFVEGVGPFWETGKLMVSGELQFFEKGLTETDFKERITAQFGYMDYKDGEIIPMELDAVKDIVFGELKLNEEGYHTVTISYYDASTTFNYYIYDETTKNKIDVQEISMFINGYGNDDMFVYYYLGSDDYFRPYTDKWGSYYEILISYSLPEYNIHRHLRINPDEIDRYKDKLSCEGVDTSKVHKSVGAYIYHDELLGDLYLPFTYAVIDEENPQVTSIELKMRLVNEYFLNSEGLEQILLDEFAYKPFEVKFYLEFEYDYGINGRNTVPVDKANISGIDSIVEGNNTLSTVYEGETYTLEVEGVTFDKARQILLEGSYIINNGEIYAVEGGELNIYDIGFETRFYLEAFNTGAESILREDFVSYLDALGYVVEVGEYSTDAVGKYTLTVKVKDTVSNTYIDELTKDIEYTVYSTDYSGHVISLDINFNGEIMMTESDFMNLDIIDIFNSDKIYSVRFRYLSDGNWDEHELYNDDVQGRRASEWLVNSYNAGLFDVEIDYNNYLVRIHDFRGNYLCELYRIRIISDAEAAMPTGLRVEVINDVYKVGEDFTDEDLNVYVEFGNGYREEKISLDGITYNGIDFSQPGIYYVTFSYMDMFKSQEFEIRVISEEVAGWITKIRSADGHNEVESGSLMDPHKQYSIGEELSVALRIDSPIVIEFGYGYDSIMVKSGEEFDFTPYIIKSVGFDTKNSAMNKYAQLWFSEDYYLEYRYDVISELTDYYIEFNGLKIEDKTFFTNENSFYVMAHFNDMTEGEYKQYSSYELNNFDISLSGMQTAKLNYNEYEYNITINLIEFIPDKIIESISIEENDTVYANWNEFESQANMTINFADYGAIAAILNSYGYDTIDNVVFRGTLNECNNVLNIFSSISYDKFPGLHFEYRKDANITSETTVTLVMCDNNTNEYMSDSKIIRFAV